MKIKRKEAIIFIVNKKEMEIIKMALHDFKEHGKVSDELREKSEKMYNKVRKKYERN